MEGLSWSDGVKRQEKLNEKIKDNLAQKNTDFQKPLDPTTKEYINNRFQDTNDDNLREEYAKNLIIGDGYELIENHANNQEKTNELQSEFYENLEKKRLGLVDVDREREGALFQQESFDKELKKLQELSEILKLSVELSERSPLRLVKSVGRKDQERGVLEQEVDQLQREILDVQSNKIIQEQVVEQLTKHYESLYKKWQDYKNLTYPDQPQNN